MINYREQANKYRPGKITTLLIGEAPPPNGKKYFYLPVVLKNGRIIEKDASLPATIFHHYFGKRPYSKAEYEIFLNKLKNAGIILVDIIDEPLRIRDRKSKSGFNDKNLKYLISQIQYLREKIENLRIDIEEGKIIFLLARSKYKKELKAEFPKSQFIRWKDFRMNVNLIHYEIEQE
ncbi:hypothetical protein ES705_20794 [subsurface metagenome]